MGKGYEQKGSRTVFQISQSVLKFSHIERSEKVRAAVVHLLDRHRVKPLVMHLAPRLWENRPLTRAVNVSDLSAGLFSYIHQNFTGVTFLPTDSTT